jgi:hypothetical protein
MEPMPRTKRFPWRYLIVGLVVLALYAVVQWSPTFKDPDSFYHLGIAERIARGEIVTEFPWLPFTTLADAYADHHFLYHVVLAPFVAIMDPFAGAKVATALLAAIAILVFMRVLERHSVRYAWVYALVLAPSASFMFRINLTKASAMALILFLLAILFASERRRWPLVLVAFLHVWTHGSWPALLAVGLFAYAGDLIERRTDGHSWRSAFRTADRMPFAFLCAGLAAGLVINPYFPANIAFYWEQIVQIALIGHGAAVAAGTEWYGYSFPDLFAESSGAFLLLASSLVILMVGALRDGVIGRGTLPKGRAAFLVTTFLLASAFFALTLRSRRHIEYFVPFFILFDAALLDAILRRTDLARLLSSIDDALGARRAGAALVIIVAGTLAMLCMRSAITVTQLNHDGIRWDEYAKAGEWLAANTDDMEVVVHAKWDAFPMLWYHDPSNRYIAGLDPMFLYRADVTRYERWVELIKGERDIVPALDMFDSRFLLIEKRGDTAALMTAAEADPGLTEVYEDADVRIYSPI